MDQNETLRDRYRGCLIGGAVGDALGAAVEFSSLTAIRARFGPQGIQQYAEAYGGLGRITHGHPTGYLTGGVLAEVVRLLVQGEPLGESLTSVRERLRRERHHEETEAALAGRRNGPVARRAGARDRADGPLSGSLNPVRWQHFRGNRSCRI